MYIYLYIYIYIYIYIYVVIVTYICFKHMLLKRIKKVFNRDSEAFHKYHIKASNIVHKIAIDRS